MNIVSNCFKFKQFKMKKMKKKDFIKKFICKNDLKKETKVHLMKF